MDERDGAVTAPYRLNLSHPEIREAYESYKAQNGLSIHFPLSDQEREAFEREYMQTAAALLAAEMPSPAEGQEIYRFGPVSLWRTPQGYGVMDQRTGEWDELPDPVHVWQLFIQRMEQVGRRRMEQIKRGEKQREKGNL